jgi:uncharacterized protein (DUF1684 family)
MPLTVAEKNRMVRREALREKLSVERHLQEMNRALDRMADLASGPIDQDTRDRFSMFNALADRHWRVVAKYLPQPEKEPDEMRVTEIRRIIINPVNPGEAIEQTDAAVKS